MIYRVFLLICLVTGSPAFADAMETARREISTQFELLKQGKAEQLRSHFTARLKDRITPQLVKKARTEAAAYTLDDLVSAAAEGEYQGQKTIKIKMKNGRTLTTLVETDGKWYADTIWFR